MAEPILDYQTVQRNCQFRWDILNPHHYVVNKVVLDIGCAQGWFIKKCVDNGAKGAIGIDIANYGNNVVLSAELYEIGSDINCIFLMSVDVDISIVDKIFKAGNVETIFFEPYLDSENKSKWKEDEWLQRFRECGYDFYKLGISDRDRSLYMLRQNNVHMEIRNGIKYAIKKNVDNNEIEFYKKFGNNELYSDFILPYMIENGKSENGRDENEKSKDEKGNENRNLVLPWAESTLKLYNECKFECIGRIKKAIDWIHSLGIVHGDLRVSNIVIYNKKPYLIDFSYWKYGNIKEDSGLDINSTIGRRGLCYIVSATMSGRIRYME